MTLNQTDGVPDRRAWLPVVARYNRPDPRRSAIQLAGSLAAYLLLMALMIRCLRTAWWITPPLAVLAAGFLVRLFIIFHDCGHGSFFRSRRLCNAVGALLGVLSLTPYASWTGRHAAHHAAAGDLDRRGVGDVWTLTVAEYRAAPRWKRLAYRLYRHPLFLVGIGAWLQFLLLNRLPFRADDRRGLVSVLATDAVLAALAVPLALAVGLDRLLWSQLPVLFLGTSAGVWLFYIQHQFEGVHWCRHGEWDYATVALKGASFYRLPKVLQWFTGNIGFHHVHHLSPRIPNYRLPACHRENPLFGVSTAVSLPESLKAAGLKLWDEERRRLVGFR